MGRIGHGGGLSFHSGASRGVCAIVVFIVTVLVEGFDRPRWRAQLRGGVWGGVCINMVWGFGCVVDMVFVSAHGGG